MMMTNHARRTATSTDDAVPTRRGRGRIVLLAVAASATALTVAVLPGATSNAATVNTASVVAASAHSTGPKPTIVLVHGAFADASGWNAVEHELKERGYTVYAPANPLRGLKSDSDYLRSFLATIPGPIVLVGHSYGGAVITDASTGNPNVKGLVYIAAYALEQGESVGVANTLGGATPSLLLQHIIARPLPGGTDADGYIDPAYFHQVFAADVPADLSAEMAAGQRGAALSSLAEPSSVPGWKTIPTWYLVASNDNAIPPAAERAMAARAHAHTVEIPSSHVAMISHPDTVTKLILAAATNKG
jgi:pimeloyl-ACP methyl ester carboxylesterase